MELKTQTPLLQFSDEMSKLRDSLSAVLFVGDTLWVASDEATSVERLSTDDGLTFKNHKSFPLDDFIPLPAHGTEFDQEIDIEGMDFLDSHLWLVGSHSIKRKKVDTDDTGTDEKLIKKLAKTEADGNRFILARIPLINTNGSEELVDAAKDPNSPNRILRSSNLSASTKSNELTDSLRKAEGGKGDIHLSRFLDIPGKDNGFDKEIYREETKA